MGLSCSIHPPARFSHGHLETHPVKGYSEKFHCRKDTGRRGWLAFCCWLKEIDSQSRNLNGFRVKRSGPSPRQQREAVCSGPSDKGSLESHQICILIRKGERERLCMHTGDLACTFYFPRSEPSEQLSISLNMMFQDCTTIKVRLCHFQKLWI